MPRDNNNVVLEGVTLIFRNFAGKEGPYNAEGNRNFGVLLDDEVAKDLEADGWAIRWLEPREDADEGETAQPMLQVKVKYGKGAPPRIVKITSTKRENLDEDEIEMLDWVEIRNADLIIRPYHWNINNKTGISAYLQSLYITIEEDELERKYSQMDVGE